MKRTEQRPGIAVWDRPLAVRACGGPYRKLYALAHSVFASDGVNSTLHKSKPKLWEMKWPSQGHRQSWPSAWLWSHVYLLSWIGAFWATCPQIRKKICKLIFLPHPSETQKRGKLCGLLFKTGSLPTTNLIKIIQEFARMYAVGRYGIKGEALNSWAGTSEILALVGVALASPSTSCFLKRCRMRWKKHSLRGEEIIFLQSVHLHYTL